MKGTLRQRSKGSWQIVVDVGTDPVTGKRRRHIETVHGPKRDAQARLAEILDSRAKGSYTPRNKLTLVQYLEGWLDGYAFMRCAPRTYEQYRSICRVHIVPALGHYTLADLGWTAINSFYKERQSGRSKKTVYNIHRVLSEALRHAVRRGLIVRNPCEVADAPKPDKPTPRALMPAEAAHLLECAKSEPQWYPIVYLALHTGMRQGELLALCWRDVNLSLGSISVTRSAYRKDGGIHYKEPKTQHSRRRISISPQVCLYLKGYRAERERIAAEIEHPLEPDNLVFSMPDGGPLSANSLIPAFQRIVRRAGLEPLRFHDLRHGCASLMFLAGVHPKVVSEMLGHSSIGITLDVYSHVLPSMQDAAVVALDEVLSEKLAANWQQKGEIEDWLT